LWCRLAGYEDVNDAECLSQDPTLRLIGSEKIWDRGAALPSRLQSFETEVLAQDQNLAGLEAINRDLIARTESVDSRERVVLDMDSTEILRGNLAELSFSNLALHSNSIRLLAGCAGYEQSRKSRIKTTIPATSRIS
jgi:hypothetical protein